MPNIIRNINESIAKLRKLLSEEAPVPTKRKAYDTDANRARAAANNITGPGEAVSRAKATAMGYADRLPSSHKSRANNVIMNTLRRGAAGAVDATFIRDLDTRWVNGQRVTMDSNDTNAYDYIIQMLAAAYNMPEGDTINIGGQEVPVQSQTRQNAYEGLSRMFDLQDRAGRWRWFIFGSNKYSMVPGKFRPKVSTLPDGKVNFAEVDKYIEDLNFILKSGKLGEMLKKRNFYDKGFAYVLSAVRNKYIDMKKSETAKGQRGTFDQSYTDPALDSSDETLLGLRANRVGKNTDGAFDLRALGTNDNGENPGHNSPKQFVNALRVNLKGKGDLDASDPTTYTMADYVTEHICKFVDEKFAQAPKSQSGHAVIPELFRANLTRVPASLQHICLDEKYKDIYPNVYAAYFGKTKTAPAMAYANWEKKYFAATVLPEFERIAKQYIEEMDLDMEDPKVPVRKGDDGEDVAGVDFGTKAQDKEKMAYSDYEDPHYKTKRINPFTKKPEAFIDNDDYFNSLEENEGEEGKKKEMLDAVMKTFAQLAAPR